MGEEKKDVLLIQPKDVVEIHRETRALLVKLWGPKVADEVYAGNTMVDHVADFACACFKAGGAYMAKELEGLAKEMGEES